MKLNEVKELMKTFENSTIREFSWTNETDSLQLSKNQFSAPAAPLSPVGQSISASSEARASLVSETSEAAAVEAEGEAVKSPLVGVAYLKASPDKPDFIALGSQVKKGQTLLIIEAMKVMNEIPAPKDGTITEILVSADEVVEYGQELVRIK